MHALAKGAARTSGLCSHLSIFDAPLRVDEGDGDVTAMTVDKETIRFLRCGNRYVGTSTLDATDTSGNPTAHLIGVIAGTRVTVETTIPDLL